MVSIIIVNNNHIENLKNCLNSIKKHEVSTTKEIIVVDNASSDESLSILKNAYPEVKVIENKTNLGPSKARNQGIGVSQGEYVLFLDSDTYFIEPIIKELVKVLENETKAAVVGPKLLNSNRALQRSCFSYPTLLKSFVDISLCYLIIEAIDRNVFRRLIFYLAQLLKPLFKENMSTYSDYSEISECQWISSACCLVRKDAVEKTGLLDENFFIYFEETDLCWRLKNKGYKILHNPFSSIVHLFHTSLKKDFIFFSQVRFESLFYFYQKNYHKRLVFLFRCTSIPAVLTGILIYPFIKSAGLDSNFNDFLSSRVRMLKTLF